MHNGLRERFAAMSDAGASLRELILELDTYKERLSPRRYDELWLFCWALAKRRAGRPISRRNGEEWPDRSREPRDPD
jgi:hypothetical protein